MLQELGQTPKIWKQEDSCRLCPSEVSSIKKETGVFMESGREKGNIMIKKKIDEATQRCGKHQPEVTHAERNHWILVCFLDTALAII